MSSIITQPLNITYTLTFKKAFHTNITKYNVYAIYKDAQNNDKKDLIKEIFSNTRTSILKFEDYITIDDTNKAALPKDIYTDDNYGIEVYKNDIFVAQSLYVFNSYLNTISFTKNFIYSSKDIIKLKYYKKLIVVNYNTTKQCTFSVEPVFKDKHLLGCHNIIV